MRDIGVRGAARAHLCLLRTELGESGRVGLELVTLVPLGYEVRGQGEHHAEEHHPRLEEWRVERLNLACHPARLKLEESFAGNGTASTCCQANDEDHRGLRAALLGTFRTTGHARLVAK